MPSVFCVADYILQKIKGTTAMKLQKLVYYCQAWSLAWDDVPLFKDDFEAWSNGPICRNLYCACREEYIIEEDKFDSYRKGSSFTSEQEETMCKVVEYYGNRDPQWLNELTHMENPWKQARLGVAQGEPSENIISKESMQEYYSGL
ncbi:MAG: DUF4065 domain-containing protein [Rikenellaceae bacterium]